MDPRVVSGEDLSLDHRLGHVVVVLKGDKVCLGQVVQVGNLVVRVDQVLMVHPMGVQVDNNKCMLDLMEVWEDRVGLELCLHQEGQCL